MPSSGEMPHGPACLSGGVLGTEMVHVVPLVILRQYVALDMRTREDTLGDYSIRVAAGKWGGNAAGLLGRN